jgi:hypothetical protein
VAENGEDLQQPREFLPLSKLEGKGSQSGFSLASFVRSPVVACFLHTKIVFVLALNSYVYIQSDDNEYRHVYRTHTRYYMNPLKCQNKFYFRTEIVFGIPPKAKV